MVSVPIEQIYIGERHRKDMGDIKSLADSIERVGLLHPIVVNDDWDLIAGERRLVALISLGWESVPVTQISIAQIARGEFDENAIRKDFTPSETVSIKRALEPSIAAEARERQGTRSDLVENYHEVEGGKTRDKVAAFVGKSGRTIEKAEKIVEALEAEPENGIIRKIYDDMERTGRIDGPHKRLVVHKKARAIREEKPPLPSGNFRVIVADPPWPYELRKADPSHRATHPYPQMSIQEICDLGVLSIAHDDCLLWLWTTNHHMREAFIVLDAWGFTHKTILTWVKDRFGTGDWLRGQTEHCLMAVRGSPVVELSNQSTVIHGPLRSNSEKPDEFYSFVEKLCPAPIGGYAELFQRTHRDGWVGHGDEVVV